MKKLFLFQPLFLLLPTIIFADARNFSPGTFYNPATLLSSRLFHDPAELSSVHDRKIIMGVAARRTHVDYNGSTTAVTPLRRPPLSVTASGYAVSNVTQYIPYFNWSIRLTKNVVAGFKFGQPFVVSINYPENSSAKYVGYQNTVNSYNIGPEIGVQVTRKLSVGFGIDLDKMNIDFSSIVLNPTRTGGYSDYQFLNNLSAWNAGWDAGFYYTPWRGAFVSTTYYSKVDFHLMGPSQFTGQGGIIPNIYYNASAIMTMPWSLRFDLYQAFSKAWGLSGSFEFVKWSLLQRLLLQNTALGQLSQEYSYKDTWRYSAALQYNWGNQWTVFAGASYHESPANPLLLRPLLPDKDFISAGLALQRIFNNEYEAKLSYQHGFIGKSLVRYRTPLTQADGTVNAAGDSIELTLTIKK